VRICTPIAVEHAADVIRDFTKISEPIGSITLKLADSFDPLPEEVSKAAEGAGSTADSRISMPGKENSKCSETKKAPRRFI